MSAATLASLRSADALLADLEAVTGIAPTWTFQAGTFEVTVPWGDGLTLEGSVEHVTSPGAMVSLLSELLEIAHDHAEAVAR